MSAVGDQISHALAQRATDAVLMQAEDKRTPGYESEGKLGE